MIHEIGWILHGAVSHLAIRRHLFHANLTVPVDLVLDAQIDSFLAGFEPMLERMRKERRAGPSSSEAQAHLAGPRSMRAFGAGLHKSRQLTSNGTRD